jgi:nucleoside-diphosphate-sugar epimerase
MVDLHDRVAVHERVTDSTGMTGHHVVLVTGATGFIGGHLLPSLYGNHVRVALRSGGPDRVPGYEAVCVGNVARDTEWARALAGVRCVVHMAAHVHVMKASVDDRAQFHEVNALGTERLALAAAAAGVKRFVFLSSIKVNGEETTERAFSASDVPHPEDDYGISKWEAEQRLFRVAESSAMEVVVLRPTLVYGPGVRGNFLKLLSAVHAGVPLPLGSIVNARSMLNVWNLCDLIVRMVEAPGIGSGVFLASDGVDLSTPELIRRIAAAMGRPARLLPVPLSLLKLAATLTAMGSSVQRLCGSLTVDMTSTRESFAWSPRVSVDQALMLTSRWYIDQR